MMLTEDQIHPDSHIEGDLVWCLECMSLEKWYRDDEEWVVRCGECGAENCPADEWEGV